MAADWRTTFAKVAQAAAGISGQDLLRLFGQVLYGAGCFLAVLNLLLAAATIGGMAAGIAGAGLAHAVLPALAAPIFWLLGYGARYLILRLLPRAGVR